MDHSQPGPTIRIPGNIKANRMLESIHFHQKTRDDCKKNLKSTLMRILASQRLLNNYRK